MRVLLLTTNVIQTRTFVKTLSEYGFAITGTEYVIDGGTVPTT